MSASGTFDVELTPQDDGESPAGRMLISKTYHGDLEGTAYGQMISKRIEGGSAVYFAIEEFTGSLEGRSGGFTLLHHGQMTAESQSLDITVLEGSGTGGLVGVTGAMQIGKADGGHSYELSFELP